MGDIYYCSHAFNKDKIVFAIAKVSKEEKKEKTPTSLQLSGIFCKKLGFRLKCGVEIKPTTK